MSLCRWIEPGLHPARLVTRPAAAATCYRCSCLLEEIYVRLLQDALAARRSQLGASDPQTLTSLNSLGLLLREEGDLKAAKPLLEEALEARRQTQGGRHPETLTALNNLGALRKAMGDLGGAERLYQEALEGRKEALGEAHPDTLTSVNNLASLYRSQGRLYEAEPLLEHAALTARSPRRGGLGRVVLRLRGVRRDVSRERLPRVRRRGTSLESCPRSEWTAALPETFARGGGPPRFVLRVWRV